MIVSMSSERVGYYCTMCLFVNIIIQGIYIRSIPVLSRESKKGILDFEFPLVRPTALSVPRFDRSVEVTVGESKGKTLT